jgi:hypothetical protein
MEAYRQSQEYNNLLDHYMPQSPTTHKDLHKAAIGLLFTLVYLFEMQAAAAETPAQAVSASVAPKGAQSKLVKKDAARAVSAPVKPMVAPTAPVTVPELKSPASKVGKLRDIPLSTLNGDKAPAKPEVKTDSKSETKTAGKNADKNANKKPDVEKKAEVQAQKNASLTKPKRVTAAAPRLNNGLVPPPPPIVPIGMDALGMYGQPVDYLSLKELEGRKKELTARFNELDSIVGDGVRQIRERQEHAALFESLYQEGVVSRKELENAKREVGEIDRDLKFKQDELESVKISMKAVNNRLAVLKRAEEKLNASKKNIGVMKTKSAVKKK